MVAATEHTASRLWLIGCGTPTPTPERFGSCLVLRVAGEHLMFDCGPAATCKLVKSGIAPTAVDHLFFTHHHYDHNADTPCFLLCRWDHERPGVPRLKVYGPPPTARIIDRLIGPEGAFSDDWRARVEHPASQAVYAARGGRLPRPAPLFDVTEVAAGDRVATRACRVTVRAAVHLQPLLQSLCYRVDWDGGSLAVTGDAGLHAGVVELARGVETLVVNVWDHQDHMSATLLTGFCGTRDAAVMARDAGVRRLVVAHQGPNLVRPGSPERAMEDMAGIFAGEIVFGEELMSLGLG